MNDDVLDIRINAAREAQRRTRIALGVAMIVSLALLSVSWNAYLSWYRSMAHAGGAIPEDSHYRHMWEQAMVQWTESQFVGVPGIGISFGVSDKSVLGGITLLVVMVWLSASARRENDTITTLLYDTQKEADSVRDKVFFGINSHMVFISTERSGGRAIASLDHLHNAHRPTCIVRLPAMLLLFVPAAVLPFAIIMDIISLFMQSAYRENNDPLWRLLPVASWVNLGIMQSIALVFAVWIYVLACQVRSFLVGTARVTNEYLTRGQSLSA